MGIRTGVREALTALLRRFDYEVLETTRLYEWQKPHAPPSHGSARLPEGADAWLRADNPRLVELRERYAAFDPDVTTPLDWTESHVGAADLRHFRGDNAYIWQLREDVRLPGKGGMNALGYALATYYVKSIDRLGLLDRLVEDDAFGNFTFQIAGKTVSRDLLDSILEIYFLERHLGLSERTDLRVLDVGAGYGRLAHRMLEALPGVRSYVCTDAFAASTLLSEYYLRHRGVTGRGKVVPLDEIQAELASRPFDLAINVHSFSECRLAAIDWWLSLLARSRVPHLMIVPNSIAPGGTALLNSEHEDFQPIVERHGYRLVAREPKFCDPFLQEWGMNPTHHYLFRLEP
jgi:hypothetical protein